MTFTQVQWAKQHDWYVSSHQTETPPEFYRNGYEVLVVEIPSGKRIWFSDFQKLREWAGY